MPLADAKQAEIIRSNQKDEYYSRYIRGALADISQSFLGPRIWIHWRKELDLLADLGYFALTTISGLQTIGEEYVNILQVDSTKRRIPSFLQRTSLTLLHVAIPYLLEKLLTWIEKQLQQNQEWTIEPRARAQLLDALPAIRHVITILHRCHLAIFYMRGVFYHIAKRFVQINYLLVRPGESQDNRPSYRILGWLSIFQLAFVFLQQIYKLTTRSKNTKIATPPPEQLSRQTQVIDELQNDPSRKCALCLEVRENSTATPCGHLFCWNCIHEWCLNKPECPLCREKIGTSRLVCLQNYDPT